MGRRNVPGMVLLTAAIGTVSWLAIPASAQNKEFGFDDSATGGGKGVAFTAAESTQVSDALTKIAGLGKIIDKNLSSYSPADIAADLRKMLEDGRLGKGKDAKKKVNASTRRDDKVTTAGDRMNLSDHFLGSASNEDLGRVMAHEWLHTIQQNTTKAEREAQAYQLGALMYLAKGGDEDDKPYKSETKQAEKYKEQMANAVPKLPDNKTPAKGGDHCDCHDDADFYLSQEPSRLYLWSGVALGDSISPTTPNRMFFGVHHLKQNGTVEWLLVPGADTTSPGAPVGVITLLQANGTHFLSRTDVVLSQLRYPLSAAQSTDRRRVYLLDTRAPSPAVWIYEDVSGDSVPDNLRPLPFATTSLAGVTNALGVWPGKLTGFPEGVLLVARDIRGEDDLTLTDAVRLLVDLNADGQADQSLPAVQGQFVAFAPTLSRDPIHLDVTAEVFGMNGHTVQVRATNAAGSANLELLGSVVASGYLPVTVPLSRPLSAGEYVIAVDVTDNTRPAAPELVTASVPAAPAGILALLAVLTASIAALELSRRARRAG
jgi:hypothetical protein